MIDEAKKVLREIGLQEVINYSFIPKNVPEILDIKEPVLEIKNPLSEDMAILRPTLMWSILANIRDNLNRNQFDLRFAEVSRVFTPKDDLANEDLRICIGLAGRDHRTLWDSKPVAYDFYDMKGYVEMLLENLGIKNYKLERSQNSNFHPGRSAEIKIGRDVIGVFGEIHPNVQEKMDIKRERVYIAELDLSKLAKYKKSTIKYESIVKYPEVTRDLAILIDRDVLVGEMLDKLKKASNLIEKIDIFDVYEGEKIENDKKSVAISITLRDKKKTLNEKQITETIEKVLEIISKNFGGEIRK